MRILHISRTMGIGGAEKIVYQLCNAKDNNQKVVVSTGGHYVKELNKNGINHYEISDINKKNPIIIIKTFIKLLSITKKENIDIIHSHHRMAAFYARIVSIFNKKVKLVYTAHSVFKNKKMLLRFSLKNTKIVAVGNNVKENLVKFYNLPQNDISVIYNSIITNPLGKEDEFLKELKTKNKVLIGSIGRISKEKGIDVFIKAINKSIRINDDIVGIIIGSGDEMDKMKELVDTLKLNENIYFLGFRKDIFDLIKQLDFVVSSSKHEGFPLTLLEVFSMKKTMIASNIPGNNEIVQNEKNGLLFEKNNINELSEKIIYLSKNLDIKQKLENEAFNDFKEKYSYESFLNKYNDIYKEIKGVK